MLSKISRSLTQAHKRTLLNSTRAFANKVDPFRGVSTYSDDSGVQTREQLMQFSKEPTMDNFGDLPFGEIPEPLKYVRPFHTTTLSNGIRVCTERTPGATAHVGVYVGAGSRHEDLQTTGASYLLQKMALAGTANKSKTEVANAIESMGARYSAHSDREWTHYNLQVHKGDARAAVALLGDALCQNDLHPGEFELAKEAALDEAENNHNRYIETTLENSHFNVYREHMMGQPIKGDRDQIGNLQLEHLLDYRAANYFGENVVIVATGDVSHEEICAAADAAFPLQQTPSVPRKNTEKPIYIPALLNIRDDEMVNSNVGVFYDAPSVKHEDYYGFLLLKHMLGNFRLDLHTTHLNDHDKQYNAMHSVLGEWPDITRADCHYFAYSDCGIFGNYFFGNEIFTRQMNYAGVCLPTMYGCYVADVECVRARNALYNSLLTAESPATINKDVGLQMLQLGRRLPRSEIAKRASHIDNYHIRQLAYKWFYDAEPSFTNWGPCESVAIFGSYKYFKICTMETVTSMHHSLSY